MKNQINNTSKVLSSSFIVALFGCFIFSYGILITEEFLRDFLYLYFAPHRLKTFTHPEVANSLVEALSQAKDETIAFMHVRPLRTFFFCSFISFFWYFTFYII